MPRDELQGRRNRGVKVISPPILKAALVVKMLTGESRKGAIKNSGAGSTLQWIGANIADAT